MASKQILVPIIDPGTMQMSVQDQVIEPQTWISDVLVPLTQNILGGIAFGTLGFIWFVARWEWLGAAWSAHDALLWCVLAGGAVACLMTILRFFSDDVGIVAAAYKAGQRSMLPRISALEEQVRATYDALQGRQAQTSTEARLLEVLTRARTDAERLIRLYFEGDKIDRTSMASRGMGQRDWERARRFLQAAGILTGEGKFAIQTPAEGIERLEQRFTQDVQHKGASHSFMSAWR